MVMGQLMEEVAQQHQELCEALSIDSVTANEAWSSYSEISQRYTLEGPHIHWLGCSLYAACRKATVPTVNSNRTIEGNLVCLTSLLMHCKMSLMQFLSKCRKWVAMRKLPESFHSKINRLEHNFAVSKVVFTKYLPVFKEMFKSPDIDELQNNVKHNKKKLIHCTVTKLFEFTWTLFILAKSEYTDISDDLVNAFHLLIACCDLMFSNVVQTKLKEIVNTNFEGLPSDFYSHQFRPSEDPLCIISILCRNHHGLLMEAKSIKEYTWRNYITKLLSKQKLRGNHEYLSRILEPEYFDFNFKAVNKMYEEYILSVGDFDERIFLSKFQSFDESSACTESPEQSNTKVDNSTTDNDFGIDFSTPIRKNMRQPTPLTGRQYLSNRDLEYGDVTPVKTATQSVARLNFILLGLEAKPNPILAEIFQSCNKNPQPLIDSIVESMGDKFCTNYCSNPELEESKSFALKRLDVAVRLFYKLLESILIDEQKKPQYDFNVLLSLDMFHETLFACCIEIVIFCYNSNKIFPWILTALNIEAYNFYRVIEVIVRAETQLARDIVKHLNLIEEQVLESMAWKTGSPLWKNIQNSGLDIPSCEQVALASQLRAITLHKSDAGSASSSVTQSPVNDRFNSPITRKNNESNSEVLPGAGPRVSLQMIGGDGSKRYITIPPVQPTARSRVIVPSPMNQVKVDQDSLEDSKDVKDVKEVKNVKEIPKRTGTLGLFFRKFYHLAFVRMEELCSQLRIDNNELKHKIWTCFEYSITHSIDNDGEHIMKNRHVDQLIMCAVYIICKVSNTPEKTFTEIMKCYRLQPQCNSYVYRCVLLSSISGQEERGDLIQFYNVVYVKVMQDFARKFSRQLPNDILTLSPLLVGKSNSTPASPYRLLSDKFAVYIRSLDHPVFPTTPNKNGKFVVRNNHRKDLEAINHMIKSDFENTRKRTALDLDPLDIGPAKRPILNKKLQSLVGERQSVLHIVSPSPNNASQSK